MILFAYHTPFRCIAPTLTTTRPFSFLSIPSRFPLDIPATFNSLVPLIISLSTSQWLVTSCHPIVYIHITFSSGHTDTVRIHLETDRPFVFPQCSCQFGSGEEATVRQSIAIRRKKRWRRWRCRRSSQEPRVMVAVTATAAVAALV